MARVRFEVGPFEICGRQSGTGTEFSPGTSVFPCQYHFHQCSKFIIIYMLLLPEGHTGEAWETSKTVVNCRKLGINWQKIRFVLNYVFRELTFFLVTSVSHIVHYALPCVHFFSTLCFLIAISRIVLQTRRYRIPVLCTNMIRSEFLLHNDTGTRVSTSCLQEANNPVHNRRFLPKFVHRISNKNVGKMILSYMKREGRGSFRNVG